MNFAQLKEHAGLAAMVIIIGWSGAQLNALNSTASKLAEELVAMREGDKHQTYRMDQQLIRITKLEEKVQINTVEIGQLKIRVFSKDH